MTRLPGLAVTHVLALAIGFGVGVYALPILTAPPAPTADEARGDSGAALFRGTFRRDLRDSDPLPWGEGALIVRFTDTGQKARGGAAESELGEAKARLVEAQLAFDRIREIYAKKLVAKAQFDRARADLDAARAHARAAQAALDEVQEELANTVIRAPYAGIVVARHVQIGETVGVGTPLLTGVSLEHLRVHVDVPHQHIGELRKHRQARVLLPEDGSIAVEELRISPNADPVTHTFRVLATVPQGDYGVYPGMLLKVCLLYTSPSPRDRTRSRMPSSA